MAILPEPYEFLDLEHSHSVVVRILKWEQGAAVIVPRAPTKKHVSIHMQQTGKTEVPEAGFPIHVQIPVLRIWIERVDKPAGVAYYDVSSKRLQADLLPWLQSDRYEHRLFTLEANGYKPTKRYSVSVS